MAEWETVAEPTPKSTTPQNAQNSPWEDVPEQAAPSQGWEDVRASGGKPERSRDKSLRETYQGYRPSWKSPEPPTDPLAVPGYLATEAAKTGLGVLGELTAPVFTARDYLYGVLAGHPGTPTSPEDIAESVRSLQGTGPKTDQWGDWKTDVLPGVARGVTELVPFLGIGGRGRRIPSALPEETPLAPRVVSPAELDMQIAERAIATGYPEPESSLIPSMRRVTGETVFAPTLETGVHGPTQGRTSRRDALGNKVRTPTGVSPGEFGPEEQLTLLGGPTREGLEVTPKGSYLYAPEEQTQIGLAPLRPQRLFIPEHAREMNAPLELDIAKALRTRVFTVAEENRILADPVIRGGAPVEVTFSPSKLTATAGYQAEERFVLPKEFTVSNTVDGAVFPSFWSRTMDSTTGAMRKAGPIGEHLATLFDMAYENRATGLAGDFTKAETALDGILGTRGFVDRKMTALRQLTQGENSFIAGMQKRWKLTEAEQESLFNHMDSHGAEPPLNDRVRQAAQVLFEHGTYPASSDPGVRMLTVKNPFTGKDIPLGEPNMFMPHQPVSAIAHDTIGQAQWELLYARKGGESLGVSLSDFKKTIIALSRHDPEVTAAKMKGLENMQLLDLGSLGGSRYQWAKKLGYETDPFRAAFRFNSMARLRGQLEQIQEPMSALLMQIPSDQTHASEWLHLASERAMLNPGKYDATTRTTNIIKGVSHVLDMTMLQLGGIANLPQVIYPIARGGAKATIQGFGALLTGADRQLIKESGALFPATLNELTNPTGPMAVISSGAFRVYGLSTADKFTRYFAANIGNKFIAGAERNYLATPANERLGKLLTELGGDPKSILEAGKIPDDMRLKMIQRFANYTAGVTDVRGVPLWATTENPWARLVNKYRTFSAANTAEIKRFADNSPDYPTFVKRAATLLAGGYAVGTGMNEFRYAIQSSMMGQEAPKHKRDWVYHAENLLMGLGGLQGMFIATAMESPARAVTNIVGGPVAGVATGLLQDMSNTIQHGVGWRSIKTLSQRAPIVGPVLGPAVRKEASKESKRLQEQHRMPSLE